MENDEKKYQDVIKALNSLKDVKASANFEADLQRRIYAGGVSAYGGNDQSKRHIVEKKSFWENIFMPARLIPSLGLVAVAVVMFFVVDTNSEEMDNPFLIEPRVREDVFAVTDYEELEKKQDELSKQKSLKKEEPAVEQRKTDGWQKSAEDKMVSGKEKSANVEGLTDEKDIARDKDLLSDAIAPAESTATKLPESSLTAATFDTSYQEAAAQIITKEELNFRQIQLTEEEQKAVNELKNQVQSVGKVNKTQK